MYKLISVCLAFSLIISAADVKTVEQVKTVEVKKVKPSSGEDLLIKTSHAVSSIKQEVSTKKIKNTPRIQTKLKNTPRIKKKVKK